MRLYRGLQARLRPPGHRRRHLCDVRQRRCAFTKFSHEFQTICDAGEDISIWHRTAAKTSPSTKKSPTTRRWPTWGSSERNLEKVKRPKSAISSISVPRREADGHQLRTRMSRVQQQHRPFLGSYGIGITRVMGVIVEKFADEKGIVWPENVAPATVYLARLGSYSGSRPARR
jgi:prolyl-tRNA synthetase